MSSKLTKNGKYPSAFHSTILERFLGEKGLIDLYDQYRAAYRRESVSRPPSDKSLRLASLAKQIGVAEAARKTGESTNVVGYAIRRVGAYQYLTGNTK